MCTRLWLMCDVYVAAVSTVLLKNEASVLPLQKGAKIALIGFATDGAVVHAGGSGSVVPSFIVTNNTLSSAQSFEWIMPVDCIIRL